MNSCEVNLYFERIINISSILFEVLLFQTRTLHSDTDTTFGSVLVDFWGRNSISKIIRVILFPLLLQFGQESTRGQ